jgi:hypothetical protein
MIVQCSKRLAVCRTYEQIVGDEATGSFLQLNILQESHRGFVRKLPIEEHNLENQTSICFMCRIWNGLRPHSRDRSLEKGGPVAGPAISPTFRP